MAVSCTILVWSGNTNGLPLIVPVDAVMFVAVVVTLNWPAIGVVLTLFNSVEPLKAVIVVPVPVRFLAPPAWLESLGTTWDSLSTTTVNASLPSTNLTTVILSDMESAVAVIVTDVLEPKLPDVKLFFLPSAPSVNVTVGDVVKVGSPLMFCKLAVNETKAGVNEPSLDTNDWASEDNRTDLALAPGSPSLPLLAAWLTLKDCIFVKLALPSACMVKVIEPESSVGFAVMSAKDILLFTIVGVPGVKLSPTKLALNFPVVTVLDKLPVNCVTPLKTSISVPLPSKLKAPPAWLESWPTTWLSLVNIVV